MFVNVYLVDRAYGGPEEGGWWFDTGEPVFSQHVENKQTAEIIAPRLEAHYSNDGRPEISSVLSEGCYWVGIEDHPAQGWPTEQPYYC